MTFTSILPEPSNDVPPIVLAVINFVAVAAFPPASPVILPVTLPTNAPVILPDALIVVNDPAAAEDAPIVVPSIAPPFISTVAKDELPLDVILPVILPQYYQKITKILPKYYQHITKYFGNLPKDYQIFW